MDAEKPVNAEVESSAQGAVPANFVLHDATAIQRAFDLLLPWSNNPLSQNHYPGQHEGALRIVNRRASLKAIRDWKAGRRRAPRWLGKVLHDLLQQQITAQQEACTMLASYDWYNASEHSKRTQAKIKAAKLAISAVNPC